MKKNWKTTTIGALGAALSFAFPQFAAIITPLTLAAVSLFAKDHDK